MNILHIKYLDNCISNTEIEYIKNNIPNRYNECQTYKSKESQILSLLSGIMIYNNLNVGENEIKYNKLKKPYIENGLYFNVSHSNSIVVFVKSEKPIGIDVEFINKKNINIIDYAYNENEKKYINECDDDIKRSERLTELWTIKECLFKASGSEDYIEPKNINTYSLISLRKVYESSINNNICSSPLYNNAIRYIYGTCNFLNELYYVYTFKHLNLYISIASILKYDSLIFEKDKILNKH